jgi:MoaA/NifB/PqqE/SkfB family radical SAM enzyme
MTALTASPMIAGAPVWRARAGTWLRAVRLAIRGRSPSDAAWALRDLTAKVAKRRGFPLPARRVCVGGRVFFDPTVPGWPSPALDRFLESELQRIAPTRDGPPPLQLAVFAITRRCPLRCRHCSEWDLLGADDVLVSAEILEVAVALAGLGAVHLELSGGEPMLRVDEVEAVCRKLGPGVDVWVLTSGFGLDVRSAARLRDAGAVGVAVSLDHWDPRRHDEFRGMAGSFERAAAGARAASAADLVVSLSLTATREFVGPDDLSRYARMARGLGAGFIRILEPRAAGRWAGQDVALTPAQTNALLRFARASNEENSDLPLVELPALSQRTVGCFGAGDRYLFVDAEGFVHACPFCRSRAGSALGGRLPAAVERLRARGCHLFKMTIPRVGPLPVPGPMEGSGLASPSRRATR